MRHLLHRVLGGSREIKCEGFELWSTGSVSILLDAKVQPLEKERVVPQGLALEQSRMGIVMMRRAMSLSFKVRLLGFKS